MALKPNVCRAARSLLGWTQTQLARAANVGLSTVHGFEAGASTPVPNNLNAIQAALEKAGIVFLNDDEPGVKLRASHAAAGDGEGVAPTQKHPGRRGGSRSAEAMVVA